MHNNSRSRNGRGGYDWQRQGSRSANYRGRGSGARHIRDMQSASSPYPIRNPIQEGILGTPPVPPLSLPQHQGLLPLTPPLGAPSMEWLLRHLPQPPPTHSLQNQIPHPGYFTAPPLASFLPPYTPPFPFGYPQFGMPPPTLPGALSFFNFNDRQSNYGLQTSPIDMRVNTTEKAARRSPPPQGMGQVEKREQVPPKRKQESPPQHQMGKVEVLATDEGQAIAHGLRQRPDVVAGSAEVAKIMKNEKEPPTLMKPGNFTASQEEHALPGPLLPMTQEMVPHKKFQYKSWTDGASASTNSESVNENDVKPVIPLGTKIRCVDKDGLVKEIRLSPFITEEDALERVGLLGVEEAQREIDAFAVLIISGARLLELQVQQKLQEQIAAAERIIKEEEGGAAGDEADLARDEIAPAPGHLHRAAGMENLHNALCDGNICKHEEEN